MRVVQAHLAQHLPLAEAGGGEHLRPQVLGQLHGGHTDTAGPGVDQHPLPVTKGRQIH